MAVSEKIRFLGVALASSFLALAPQLANADWLDSVKSAIEVPKPAEQKPDAAASPPPSIAAVLFDQVSQNQTQLIRSFVESQQFLLQAQVLLASAFGLKAELAESGGDLGESVEPLAETLPDNEAAPEATQEELVVAAEAGPHPAEAESGSGEQAVEADSGSREQAAETESGSGEQAAEAEAPAAPREDS